MGSAPEGEILDALLRRRGGEAAHGGRSSPVCFRARNPWIFLRARKRTSPCLEGKLKEVQRLTMGFHEVFGAMYTQMGFDKVGSRKKMAARLSMRLAAGGSK